MFVGGRRLGPALLAALMCLGVAGCSGDGGSPAVLPPVSTTPSPSQTSAPPESPKAAAVAVVREYFRAKNALAVDTSATRLAAVTTPGCSCRELVRSARKLRHRGQHYFGHATLTALTPTVDSPHEVEVLVSYDSTVGGIKDSAGHVVSQGSDHHGVRQLFDVRLIGGDWLVADILLVKAGA